MAQELIVSLIAATLALGALVIGDRLRPRSWRQADDESSGTLVLDLIKTFFTAVVAFVVVISWQQYQNARGHTIAESKALVDAYWAAEAMPEPEQVLIQSGIRDYTDEVMNAEWAVMNRESGLSGDTQRTFDNLRATVTAMAPSDTESRDRRDETAEALKRVALARQDRAIDAREGLPGFLYAALIFGTALLLLSPILSGVRISRRSVVMTGLLGIVVGSALLQVHNLDHPFSGGNLVSREAFELAVTRYQQIEVARYRLAN
ncbi:bestrophin-like domain [Nocardia bovistercoris]|uniref:DUF4239 domain-containing protein n=1 Tax=Nocardia bovistercoris TaxID=2785916 RepID=A0A931IAJ5_9NOCA|nr:DUF4239 domain-containing protein [Nocardia bovistercoris]MBH0776923.1 DUF4239 domain-containing protein [Nocardia bovistercoris]